MDIVMFRVRNPVSKAETDDGASTQQKTIPISSILSTAFYHD